MSYRNLTLYISALPSYDSEDKKEDKWDESLDANNPSNFSDEAEIEYVR
ncbi:MAG: hypothetical protein MJZ41_07540 [Bacteroidaceae bacterium]|nr:hypothetical protein [Bacteroidaceae bacterium]